MFRRQLLAGYAAFVLISMATALFAVVELRVVSSGAERVVHRYTDHMLGVERVRFQAERVIAAARGYVMMRAADYLDRLKLAAAEFDARLAALRAAALVDETTDDLRAIADDVHAYASAAGGVGEHDPREVDRAFEQILHPQLSSLHRRADALARRERETFEGALSGARVRAERAGVLVAIASTVGLVTSILLAVAVLRRLARLYAQQRKAVDEARQAAAAREDVLAMVSHDLRGPLHTVTLASDLLVMKLAGTSAAEEARKYAATIRLAADRMNHLVGRVLDGARIDVGSLHLTVEACNVADVLRAATDLFEARASQASVSLRCEPPGEPVIAHADKQRVIEILSNLLDNALKFTPAGGTVTARGQIVGELVELEIEDTGAGIARDRIDKVFDRYWRDPRAASRGIGLGLHICHKLVEAHGGRIWVESEPDRGSCFHFTLPRGSSSQVRSEPVILTSA